MGGGAATEDAGDGLSDHFMNHVVSVQLSLPVIMQCRDRDQQNLL